MLTVIQRWAQRYLSDPQALSLIVILGGALLLLTWMGKVLEPVVASIVIAYLLKSGVDTLVRYKIPTLPAVLIVYSAFLGLFLTAILVLWPIVWEQMARLYVEFPAMIKGIQHFLNLLPQKFPQFLTKETVEGWVAGFLTQLKGTGKVIFTASLASLPNIVALVVYLVLVPLMVFFFLKDHHQIINWLMKFLPSQRQSLMRVWQEVNKQIGNYIRGKVLEVLIVGFSTYVLFYLFGMHYAALLAVLVGLSVFVPYVGVVMVTIPVIIVAFFQWGFDAHFAYLLLSYSVMQALDGSILVPLLFSGVVNLHPIAIIVAVLVFGAWWGFWGIFFAIPLATLVNALIRAWPRQVNADGR